MMHMHDTSLNITQSTEESDVLTFIFFLLVIVMLALLFFNMFYGHRILLETRSL